MSRSITPYQTSIGPTHPAFKEPIQLVFDLCGETILKANFAPGQAHRGVEWMGTRRNPVQVLYLAERLCGICGITHSLAFARAVEQIAGIQVPPRAHYIRSIACELERIHSHLLWAGVAAHELGFDSLFYLTWRARERVMDLMEAFTGNRVHYALIQIGGVRRDLSEDMILKIKETLDYYAGVYDELRTCLLEDSSVRLRCRDVGILTATEALELCAVGPTARASGVPSDIRRDHPYAAYADVEVTSVLPNQYTGEIRGDVYDRIVVRVLELQQSVKLIRGFLDQLPEGDLLAIPKIMVLLAKLKKAEGEAVGLHEAPRGEVAHYVRMGGAETIAAWKVKASSYSNYMSWVPMLVGEQVADIPIIAASIDPCISCTDRVMLTGGGRNEVWTKEDLTRLSVAKTRRIQAKLKAEG
ncbi:MAG: nickel-dependent hydrogenase large subunit [Verrucomicrobiota bacterium]|jgi:membrane-bound hydrogenase subunit alpha|nr:nickel-dependent hydrogenase large subunit [Verrucomicrobiota bacterium]